MSDLINPSPATTQAMKLVLVLQGVPGSGKSYFAADRLTRAHAQVVTCSADDYFVQLGGGKYAFDPSKLGEAHGACFRKFIATVQKGQAEMVIVDNTNTTVAEISPYVLAAEAFGYEVEILRINCDPEVAAARNTHGVPPAAIHAMAARIASCEIPPWWKLTEIPAV